MNNTSKPAKTQKPFLDRCKSTKFIIVNLLVLATLGFALFSGDGGNILKNYYQKVTGQKLASYAPATDTLSQSYQILKFKLLAEDIKINESQVEIFKESDSLHKYRVSTHQQTLLYVVEKQSNGIWQITQSKP